MPKFLGNTDEKSNLKPIHLIDRSEWDDVRTEVIALFKQGIINRETIYISDNHYNLLGSILFKAMEIGLKKTRVRWFFPHFLTDRNTLTVETTNEKIIPHYPLGVLYLYFDCNYQERLHFSLDITIPNFLFDMIYETTNEFWELISQLFAITNSRFSESVFHQDVDKKLLDNGNYGFYKFIKYLISTEIKPFSNPDNHMDTTGDIQLAFDAYMNLEELVEKLSKAVAISNKIYSHLMRKHYLKEKRKQKAL